MFGRKKKREKNQVKTYVDGQEVEEDIPVPKPADAPAHEPEQVPAHEPPHQPEAQVIQTDAECIICLDYGFYADNVGVWHKCPRCKGPTEQEEISPKVSTEKPSKGNLYEFRSCPHCFAQNEIHKKKKKWKCENCGGEVS